MFNVYKAIINFILVLYYYNSSKRAYIKTDTSNYIINKDLN